MKNINFDSSYKIELHIFPSIYQESRENLHHLPTCQIFTETHDVTKT